MVRKIACGPSKLTFGGPAGPIDFRGASNTVINSFGKNLGPLKIMRALKDNIEGPNEPWQLFLIFIPVYRDSR